MILSSYNDLVFMISGKETKQQDIWKGSLIIWEYMLRYKKEVLLMLFVSILLAVLQAFIPYVTGLFFDGLVNLANGGPVPLVIFSLSIVLTLVVWVFDIVLDRIARPLGKKISAWYTSYFFQRLIGMPVIFIKNKKRGAIHTKYNRARNGIADMISYFAAGTAVDVIKIAISMVIVFWIHWFFGIILLTGLIIFQIVTWLAMSKIKLLTKKKNKMENEAGSKIHEAVDNFIEVKKNHAEKHEKNKIFKAFEVNALKAHINLQLLFWRTFAIRNFILLLTGGVLSGTGMLLIGSGGATIGMLVAVNLYAQQMFSPLKRLANILTNMSETAVTVYESEELLTGIEPEGSKKNIPLRKIKGNIDFKKVSFFYDKKEEDVLKNIDMEISSGQRVAFVGKSGSGKSTTVDLVGAFYKPQKGEVLIDGISTEDINLDHLRSQMAYVSQDVVLFADTIENNIRYGNPKASRGDVRRAAEMAYCDEFIVELPKGYKSKVGERGVKLSGGQKQRIAIARAILRNPRILILDEPTSALDIESEKFISKSLDELMKGRTTIIIAHRLSTVRSADNIFVYEDGKIIESGTHEQLLKQSGEYKRMHNLYLE